MANVAVNAVLSDDPWMSEARGHSKKANYTPPAHSQTTMLSEALDGTERLADARQTSFLAEAKTRGDLRLFFAGDLSLLKRPCVSIVGTRGVSQAGVTSTEWLTRKLVGAG